MSDNLPTVWPAEPHTLAKHAILKEYLKAWMPILSRQSARVHAPGREVLFVDGFAGPGRYSGGEPGSPGRNVLIHNGREVEMPPKFTAWVEAGDILSIQTPGGGGWGRESYNSF